jgi:hypothetical protein
MKRVPTDREILEAIYRRYYSLYTNISSGRDAVTSDNRIYLPVDLAVIADELETDGNLVFGRLYYYLDQKHAYKAGDGAEVHLFWLRFGSAQSPHQINFPMLASVLAALQEDERRVRWTRSIAIGSVIVATAALALSVATTLWSVNARNASASTSAMPRASSNSAWVLWEETYHMVIPPTLKGGTRSPTKPPDRAWRVEAATTTLVDCEKTKADTWDRTRQGLKSVLGEDPAPQDGSKDKLYTSDKTRGWMTTTHYICLPDTIDPRGAKGK